MLAKLTSKNQLTLPKSVTEKLGPVQYFEVQLQAGQVLLTPVRIQRGDAVRAKLAELELGDEVVAQAIAFASKAARPAAKGTAKVIAATASVRQRGARVAEAVSKVKKPAKAVKPATATKAASKTTRKSA